jgi:tripartite-type tricarboxylate transporter receptor subunit TctC
MEKSHAGSLCSVKRKSMCDIGADASDTAPSYASEMSQGKQQRRHVMNGIVRWWLTSIAALVLAATASIASAQNTLNKPVTLLVGFAPGGPTDQFARAVAPKMAQFLGVPVVVDNKTGAGGGLGTTGMIVINPQVIRGLGVDTFKDLTLISPMVSYENILLVRANSPAKNLKEFIALAKANPNKVTYGSGGNGASNHLGGVLLQMASGAQFSHIPYRGSGPAMTDLLAGTIDSMFDVLATAMPHTQSGRLKALAVTGTKRSRFVPDVPTFAEAGLPEFERLSGGLWFGIYGPAGTPPEIVAQLRAALSKVKEDPDVKTKISDLRYETWDISPSEYPDFYRSEFSKWGAAIKAGGVKPE